MRIKHNLKVIDVANEHIVMQFGTGETSDMTTTTSLNESALLMVEKLRGREFDIDDMVNVLTENYEIDAETARRDVVKTVEKMIETGIIEK